MQKKCRIGDRLLLSSIARFLLYTLWNTMVPSSLKVGKFMSRPKSLRTILESHIAPALISWLEFYFLYSFLINCCFSSLITKSYIM